MARERGQIGGNRVACWLTAEVMSQLMKKRTLEQLEAAFDAVRADVAPRVEDLAQKSTAGTLTAAEHAEYAEVVRLNEMLSLVRLLAEQV